MFDERFTTVFMRKMVTFYIKGMRGAAEAKRRLFAAQTTAEVAALAQEVFEE